MVCVNLNSEVPICVALAASGHGPERIGKLAEGQ